MDSCAWLVDILWSIKITRLCSYLTINYLNNKNVQWKSKIKYIFSYSDFILLHSCMYNCPKIKIQNNIYCGGITAYVPFFLCFFFLWCGLSAFGSLGSDGMVSYFLSLWGSSSLGASPFGVSAFALFTSSGGGGGSVFCLSHQLHYTPVTPVLIPLWEKKGSEMHNNFTLPS